MHEHDVDRVHPESVVLDIGGDIGALILYTDAGLRGREFEISPKAEPDARTHVEVLERHVNGVAMFAATYYGLHDGEYTLWADKTTPACDVTIKGGEVATVDWRGRPLAPSGPNPQGL